MTYLVDSNMSCQASIGDKIRNLRCEIRTLGGTYFDDLEASVRATLSDKDYQCEADLIPIITSIEAKIKKHEETTKRSEDTSEIRPSLDDEYRKLRMCLGGESFFDGCTEHGRTFLEAKAQSVTMKMLKTTAGKYLTKHLESSLTEDDFLVERSLLACEQRLQIFSIEIGQATPVSHEDDLSRLALFYVELKSLKFKLDRTYKYSEDVRDFEISFWRGVLDIERNVNRLLTRIPISVFRSFKSGYQHWKEWKSVYMPD